MARRRMGIGGARALLQDLRPGGSPGASLFDFPEWAGPPPGTYDPSIYYEARSSQRGLEDLLEKLERTEKRSKQDVGQKGRELKLGRRQGLADINRKRGYSNADYSYQQGRLGINFARDVQDLSTAKLRGQQDYTRTLTDLQHRYGAAAEQQLQNSIQQGTDETGTNTASAAVRAANQAYDKSGIDLSHQRAEQDFATRGGRLTADYGEGVHRLAETHQRDLTGFDIAGNRLRQGTHRDLNHLYLAALRARQDNASERSHAIREQSLYQQQAQQQAYYQAHQLHPNIVFPGSNPPTGPHTGPTTSGPHSPHSLGNAWRRLGDPYRRNFPRRPGSTY